MRAPGAPALDPLLFTSFLKISIATSRVFPAELGSKRVRTRPESPENLRLLNLLPVKNYKAFALLNKEECLSCHINIGFFGPPFSHFLRQPRSFTDQFFTLGSSRDLFCRKSCLITKILNCKHHFFFSFEQRPVRSVWCLTVEVLYTSLSH